MPFPLIAAAAIPSVVKGIAGIADIFGGKARARRNIRPTAEVNNNYLKNVQIAEQMGRTGLPAEQYNLAQQNIQRNQAGAFNALGRSANPTAGINSLLRASNDAQLGLDVQNANTRLNNQRFAFGQRNNLAQEQQRVWNWNNRDRYLEEANAAGQQIGSGKTNAFGALTDLSALGQQYLASENGGQSSAANAGSGQLPQLGYRGTGSFGNPYSDGTPNFYNQMGKYGRMNFGTGNSYQG